jgi:hypothetical protein
VVVTLKGEVVVVVIPVVVVIGSLLDVLVGRYLLF